MKGLLKILFALLMSTLITDAGSVSYSYSYGSTVVGDVLIQTLNNGNLYCDSMICPQGTSNCRVTKRNDPNNFQVIIRQRKCLDGNGGVLLEETVNEPNTSNGTVNMVVSSGAGGNSIINNGGTYREMTPEEKREFDETMRRTQEQVSSTINQIQEQMEPFTSGRFAMDLNNRIQSSVRNALNFG